MITGPAVARAVEELGFKRGFYSVVRARGSSTYHIHVLAGKDNRHMQRHYLQLCWPLPDCEPLESYLRRKLPCPNGHTNMTASEFSAIRELMTLKS